MVRENLPTKLEDYTEIQLGGAIETIYIKKDEAVKNLPGTIPSGEAYIIYTTNPEESRETYWGLQEQCLPEGEGMLIYKDNKKYTGEFSRGVYHSMGTMLYPDGATYTGSWHYGQKQGQGTMCWPDGTKYIGSWHNGQQDGRGTLTFANGSPPIEMGLWHQGIYISEDLNTEIIERPPSTEVLAQQVLGHEPGQDGQGQQIE